MNLHGGIALALLLLPGRALADDLGDAIAYIEDNGGEEAMVGWESMAEPDSNAAMPMLVSRDVKVGAPLESYDCSGSAIDQPVLRTNGEEKFALRWCMESRWERDSLAGYRTLGSIRLKPAQLADVIAIASRETNVPAALLDLIIRYSSGYRPGVVSEDGRYGLMQLSPENLRAVGVEFTNLLDARENVLTGARYIARLTHRFGDLQLAMAAYRLGPRAVEAAGNEVPNDRQTIWFTREMLSLYYASLREVPQNLGLENVEFVWTWME